MNTPTSRKAYWMLIDERKVAQRPNMAYQYMRPRADAYFKMCLVEFKKDDGIRPTLTGLAYHLGFHSIAQMKSWEKKPVYQMLINKCMMLVENYYESMGPGGGAFSIFALKNLGWTDLPLQEGQGGVKVNEVIVTIHKGGKVKQLKDGKMIALKKSS